MEYVFGILFIIMGIVGISALAFFFIDSFKKRAKLKIYKFKSYLKLTYEKALLLHRIWKEIYHTYTSHSIEMLFQAYIYFYEKNYNDLEGWGYVDGVYSKLELMQMYKWIKHIRPNNYTEFKKINYDYNKKCFEYWGSHYEFLKYKVDNDGEIKIHPVEFLEAEHPDIVFQRMMMKLQNDLYDLDTQKANWILERRKYLSI